MQMTDLRKRSGAVVGDHGNYLRTNSNVRMRSTETQSQYCVVEKERKNMFVFAVSDMLIGTATD
jgi:hypothetical protein